MKAALATAGLVLVGLAVARFAPVGTYGPTSSLGGAAISAPGAATFRGLTASHAIAEQAPSQASALPAAAAHVGPTTGSPRATGRWRASAGAREREQRGQESSPRVPSLLQGASPEAPSLHLLDVFERPGDPVVAVAGLDRSGPRDLVLWQVDARRRRAAPVARLRSGLDGAFAIERLLLSSLGVRLVATEAGGDPFGPGASAPVEFAPRPQTSFPAWLESSGQAVLELVAVPDTGPQVLVLGDDNGNDLVRVELPARSSSMPAGFVARLRIDPAAIPSRVAREAADGIRSQWHPLVFAGGPSAQRAEVASDNEQTTMEDVR